MHSNKKTVSKKLFYKSKKEKTKHKTNANTKTYKNKLNYRKTKKNKTYNSKYNKKGGAYAKINTIKKVNAVGYTLKNFIFLDNEINNFTGIENTNVTCIKVADKGDKEIPTKQYDERFDDYWKATRDNNQIVENVPADFKKTTFAYFDTHNSLTTKNLKALKLKLKSGGKRICLWDWDRTISMEEGFQAHPTTTYTSLSDPLYEHTTFINNEIYNKHNEVDNLNNIFIDYMDYMHNEDPDIYNGVYKLDNPIDSPEYTNYLLGGEDRVKILREIFSLKNVKHCVISNNPSFDLTNKKTNKLLLIRAIFYEMGLNSEQNNNILLLHCGSKAVDNGGYTKPDFVNLVSDSETKLINPDEINNLRDLSDYRIYQLLSFLRNEETPLQQPPPRTMSEPVKPSGPVSEHVKRSHSAPSKLLVEPPERVTSEE